MQQQRKAQIETALREAGLYPGLQARSTAVAGQVRAFEGENLESLRWVLTTEQPATVFDWSRFDFVDEILIMDGVLLPAIKQVPFLDSHSRRSIDDILGSVTGFTTGEVEGHKALEGVVDFANDERSQRARQKARDGHLTDGSVGYEVLKSIYVPEGDAIKFKGREYKGPVKLSHTWALKEFSGTPIGADALAKVQSLIG